jgi:two-component system phosphate regulon response regulator PhoB
MGADDYITKPFSPKVMVARAKAVLRRREAHASNEVQKKTIIKGIAIDSVKHEVTVDGVVVEFTASEFRLLHYLASHAGRVFTREQILNHVVGEGNFVVDRNIDVHVRMIRKKLGAYRDIIKTIRGIGYRMDEDRGSE